MFGGGCFWCTETIFLSLKGVISVMPGYTGGAVANPTYEQVCGGGTNHIEAVKIEFDPGAISYGDLLSVFFYTHDPTTVNRQGNDIGEQYNSVVFYSNESQKTEAESLIKDLNDSHAYENQIVTQIRPLGDFYPAEDYHQKYYENHKNAPYCQIVIEPKLEKLRTRFAKLLQN